MRVFVPVEDGPLDAASAMWLVPYRCGIACEHAMRDRQSEPPAPRSLAREAHEIAAREVPDARGTPMLPMKP